MTDTPFGSEDKVGAQPIKGRSLWSDAWHRLMRNKAAVTAMILLGIIAFLCVFGPMLTPHAIDAINWSAISQPPTLENFYIFGTDGNGRDLLTRVLMGGRVSLMI
ncbi:MAG: peptide ABC transporter permease, partial [Pseudomonadota bacterium]